MKIVFIDQLGCYAAVMAASYEAGLIAADTKACDIARLRRFAAHRDMSVGQLSYIGTNPAGEDLFTLGAGRYGCLIAISACDLFRILGTPEEVRIIDVSSFNSLLISITAYLKLTRLLQNTSVMLAALVLKKRLPQIVRKVSLELKALQEQ